MSHRLRGALRRRGAQAAIGSLVATGTLAGVGVASSAQDETINASSSTWEPADVAIETGESVTWSMDTSNVPHNLVASDGEENDPAWTGQKIPIQVGGTFTYRFTKPGVYAFLCQVHPTTMRGTVTVTGDPVDPTPTPTTTPGEPTPTPTSTPPTGTPTPTPTADPGGNPPDDHTSTPAPAGIAARDAVAPAITNLALKRIKRGARVSFSLSETATVMLTARKGGRTVRTLRLQVRGGDRRVKVRRLRKGRHTFTLLARDAAGNRSETVSSSIRVRRK
jgi:plastocyanin